MKKIEDFKTTHDVAKNQNNHYQIKDAADYQVVSYLRVADDPSGFGEIYVSTSEHFGRHFVDHINWQIFRDEDELPAVLIERDESTKGSWSVSDRDYKDALENPSKFGLIMEPEILLEDYDIDKLARGLEHGNIIQTGAINDRHFTVELSNLAGGDRETFKTKNEALNWLSETIEERRILQNESSNNSIIKAYKELTSDYIENLNKWEKGQLFSVVTDIFDKTQEAPLRVVDVQGMVYGTLHESMEKLNDDNEYIASSIEDRGLYYDRYDHDMAFGSIDGSDY